MLPVMKRTVALAAGWTASAAAAVGLGFLAVSFVDASASPGAQPVTASTTGSATATPSPSGTPAPTAPARPATGEYVTAGGTAYANCTAGRPVVAAVPAAGWWVDDSNEPGKVEFERGEQKVEVRVSCVDGSPVFVLDDERSSSPSSSSSSPATETSGHDDSGGDSSGHGRGGDDSDDDSSGHGRGGDDSSDDSSGHGGSDHD
jgi:hypothetical protein